MTEYFLPDRVTVAADVVHTRIEGYRPLALDLYLPTAGVSAVCVYAHGGGWRRGSRREGPGPLSPTSRRLFGRMAASGMAVASVDYRLSGEARFPAQIDDARAACRWLTDDPASPVGSVPLVLFGVSAGGQIAGLFGLDPGVGARAVALWYPVTDLPGLPDDNAADGGAVDRSDGSREALLLGGTASALPERARAASPVHQVRSGAPPFLLLHGDADRAVSARQSERLHDALLAAGGQSTFEPVAGHDHMFAGMPDAEVETLVDRTTTFLTSHLASP